MIPFILLLSLAMPNQAPSARKAVPPASTSNVKLPPFLVWAEPKASPEGRAEGLLTFPLAALVDGVWTDISWDPESTEDWKKLPPARFPLRFRPQLKAYARGGLVGTIRPDSVGPEQVSCNQLVLGKGGLLLRDTVNPTAVASGGFVGLYGLPEQRVWKASLSQDARSQQEVRLAILARARVKTPTTFKADKSEWTWLQFPPSKAILAVGRIVFRRPGKGDGLERVSAWNAVVSLDARGEAKVLWESSGTGSGDGVPAEYEFLDAVDLDGDGTPELIFRSIAYESVGFTILKLGPGKPQFIWTGSGYGC